MGFYTAVKKNEMTIAGKPDLEGQAPHVLSLICGTWI